MAAPEPEVEVLATPCVGLMSGTSADGVDAVLVCFSEQRRCRLLARTHVSYPATLRTQILQLGSGGRPDSLTGLLNLDAGIGECFARAAKQVMARADLNADQVSVIGSHGQTVAHRPHGARRNTLQLGDPNRIVARCGVPVVADFRRMDMALGGQGAPLVPAFHRWMFARDTERRAVVNLGGIANVTLLPAASVSSVRGYDTGPGNALLDEWVRYRFGRRFDAGGRIAARGRANHRLLKALLDDPYFRRPPPKSTGRDYFNLAWTRKRFPGLDDLDPVDVTTTLCELTAETLAAALRRQRLERILVCGGGTRNRHLMQRLRDRLHTAIETTDGHGVPAQQVEATAFAWLAWSTINARAGNLPTVTGARSPAILGGMYLPPAWGQTR